MCHPVMFTAYRRRVFLGLPTSALFGLRFVVRNGVREGQRRPVAVSRRLQGVDGAIGAA